MTTTLKFKIGQKVIVKPEFAEKYVNLAGTFFILKASVANQGLTVKYTLEKVGSGNYYEVYEDWIELFEKPESKPVEEPKELDLDDWVKFDSIAGIWIIVDKSRYGWVKVRSITGQNQIVVSRNILIPFRGYGNE